MGREYRKKVPVNKKVSAYLYTATLNDFDNCEIILLLRQVLDCRSKNY